uniref:Protein kinase domain-containing protein n=1 Tax=Populus alba TaxID=43335 RepID=A0A4U5PQS8_POPAL|nr:hypothetical protein D5086_0000192520 [Populus alba]
MASGTNKTWSQDFPAYVGDDHLLTIHFFRAGKGTFLEPRFFNSPAALSLNGPLVSGISVTANFKVGGKKLSPSQIAGIIAGSVFASLLLSAYMWKMGWLQQSDLNDKTIKVPGGQGSRRWRDFTPNKIIDGTRKFSPKMKIGGGRFGIVYEAGVLNDKGRIIELVDQKLESNYDKRQALIVLHLAMKCVNPFPTLRPKMSEVVNVLECEKSPQQISQSNATLSGGKIGVCVSKPAAAAAAAREEVVVRRVSPPPQSPARAAAVATKGHSGLLSNSKSGHPVLLRKSRRG